MSKSSIITTIKKKLSLLLIPLLIAAQLPLSLMMPSNAYAANGNNGTLKVHEFGTSSGTESNDPKVCVFNFEGFGFDSGQTGYIKIDGQGQTITNYGPFSIFGPADNSGYYATAYFNQANGTQIADGQYKATLYGKDTGGNIDLRDEKAKSKVFKVECAPSPESPTAIAAIVPCTANSGLTDDVEVTVTNADDATNASVMYTVSLGAGIPTQQITLADGASGDVTFTGLAVGTYSASILGSDGTSTSSGNVNVTLCQLPNLPATPVAVTSILPCTFNSGLADRVSVLVTNADDATNASVTYTVSLGAGIPTQQITLADGASGSVTFSGLVAGQYSATVNGNDGTSATSGTVQVELCQNTPDTDPAYICHALGNGGYQKINNINAEGVYNGHLGNSHQDGKDVIPPFMYNGLPYSQNWDAAGQALYYANCDRPASITVIKDARPNDAQNFGFTLKKVEEVGCADFRVLALNEVCVGIDENESEFSQSFELDDDSDATLSNSKTFNGLSAGTYTVTEDETSGWTLADIDCDAEFEINGRTATFTLAEGEDVTCTFVNDKQGGQVLGDSTTKQPQVAAAAVLANTGDAQTMRNTYVGLTLLLAGIVNLVTTRRQSKAKA